MTVDIESLRVDYDRDGYVMVPDLLAPDLLERLRTETQAIATGERGVILGAREVGAGIPSSEVLAHVLTIHFPHKASQLMAQMLSLPEIVGVLTALVGPDVKAMRSMMFVKNAGKAGQAWYQDDYYIPTRDKSLIGVWIALDDATIENGCLWMHPGSHREGVIWLAAPHNDPRFDNGMQSHSWSYNPEGGVPVEVKAGGVAFFKGYTLHRSLNITAKSGFRRALVNHYMSARSMLPWSSGIPPVPREDFRDNVMVAGDDPYAGKGLEEITFPFLRPADPEMAQAVFGQALEFSRGRAAA